MYANARQEFSTFLRERAILEEKHANGLKKLTRSTQELVRRPENRQGSFGQSYEEMTRIQDRMADNGMEFAQNLHMMAEELQDLAAGSERGRKEWKHKGLDAEQRATDAELTMEKAKARYFSLAEQYDRARTGERQGKSFGLKGPKSAAQQEEALLSKVQNADAEYSDRVQAARSQRQELISSSRPQALRELQNCIMECDAGLGMQLQKFALLNEKLLLHNGLSVSPLKNQTEGSTMGPRSLRDLAHHVNNQQDFDNYVLGHTSHVGPTPAEIQYEKHPAMMPSTQQSVQQPLQQPYGGGQPVAASTASIMGALDKRDTRNRSESGTLDRRDTDASLFNGPATSSGSTFAASQSQMQSQPSAQGGVYTPNQTSSTTAPQLPQIGALSMGGASGLGSSIPGSSTTLGSETDRRNFSGPQQHRPGQPSFSGPTQTSQYNAGSGIAPGVGAQRDHYNTGSTPSRDPYNTGAAPSHDPYSTVSTSQRDPYGPGNGSGRGQPLTGNNNNAYTIGHSHTPSSQLPHSSEGRNQSYGQAGDFRSDGPSLPAGSAYQTPRTDNKYSPTQPGFQSQYTEGRGGLLPSSSYQSQQPEGRGMPTQSNYLYQQQNGRGQPIQSESYRSTGTSSSGNNGSTYGPSSNNNHGSPSTVAGAPPVPGHRMPSSNVSSVPSVRTSSSRTNLPPLKPVFGVSLDDLFRRDGGAVPPIVYQCVQAVDLYGLNTEGIYRTSGSAQHIMELRALFDHGELLSFSRGLHSNHNRFLTSRLPRPQRFP